MEWLRPRHQQHFESWALKVKQGEFNFVMSICISCTWLEMHMRKFYAMLQNKLFIDNPNHCDFENGRFNGLMRKNGSIFLNFQLT